MWPGYEHVEDCLYLETVKSGVKESAALSVERKIGKVKHLISIR